MGLKQILLNLSWDTLVNLPPTELLALLVLGGLVAGAVYVAAHLFYDLFLR